MVFAVVYTFGFLLVVLITVGAGEGTMIFAVQVLTWPLVLICIALMAWLDQERARFAFVALLLVHYGASGILFWLIESENNFRGTSEYISLNPKVIALSTAWCLAGQAVLWMAFFWRSRSTDLKPCR